MDLNDLLPIIKNYDQIMVSGPQRSGTTIAAKILAMELGYPFLEEEVFGVHDVYKCFELYKTLPKFVLQAPALSAYVQFFPGAIVFMNRPINEIILSQKRINWSDGEEYREKTKYFLADDENNIAAIKYKVWERYQRYLLNKFDLNYYSLKVHQLWIEADKRTHFHSRQTTID